MHELHGEICKNVVLDFCKTNVKRMYRNVSCPVTVDEGKEEN